MRSGEAVLPVLVLSCVAACAGGLFTDAGNAYPCDFSQNESTRDQACPPGWICGVMDQCQALVDEGVLDGSVPPTLDAGYLFAPAVLNTAVQALARDPVSGWVVAQLTNGQNVLAAGPTAQGAPALATFSEGVYRSEYAAYVLDGGTAVVSVNGGAFGALSPTGIQRIVHLRSFPGPPTPPLQLIYVKVAQGPLQTGFYDVGGGSLQEMPTASPAAALVDARLLPSDLLGLDDSTAPYTSVAVLVLAADVQRRPQLYYHSVANPASSESWEPLEDPTAPAASLSAAGSGVLRHSPNGEVWAAVLRDVGDGDVLATWALSFTSGLNAERIWKDCTPCAGRVRAFQPTFDGAAAVEVLCEAADGVSRTTVSVHGSTARTSSDGCDSDPLAAPFDLLELNSVDDSYGGQVTLGGASGELWTGSALSSTVPLFLDRIPDAIGSVTLNVGDGGTGTYVLPFSDSFFSVGGANANFPAYASSREGVPQAPISGVPNWLVTDGARIIKLQAGPSIVGASTGTPYAVRYGPDLIDPQGNAQVGPYGGAALGDAGVFVISAADSLYLYSIDTLRDTPFVDPSTDLSPELTPQAGSPIRSVAVDPPDPGEGLDGGIHGYAISGSQLYRFSRDGAPIHWDSTRIVLSSSEPVEVWSVMDGRKLGRVGFRDGSVFTLPSGLPLVDPLPASDSDSDRVFDYEDIGGYPVCFSTQGLFVAQPVNGKRTLSWVQVPTPDDVTTARQQPQGGKMARTSDGSLLVFVDRGRVYAFPVSTP